MRWGKKQARKAILPSASVCMIEMILVSGYLFKKTPENPLPSGLLSRHGVKEKHQPSYQKLVLTMAEKERFELSNGFTRYTISSRAPSTKLGDFSIATRLARQRHLV